MCIVFHVPFLYYAWNVDLIPCQSAVRISLVQWSNRWQRAVMPSCDIGVMHTRADRQGILPDISSAVLSVNACADGALKQCCILCHAARVLFRNV